MIVTILFRRTMCFTLHFEMFILTHTRITEYIAQQYHPPKTFLVDPISPFTYDYRTKRKRLPIDLSTTQYAPALRTYCVYVCTNIPSPSIFFIISLYCVRFFLFADKRVLRYTIRICCFHFHFSLASLPLKYSRAHRICFRNIYAHASQRHSLSSSNKVKD